MVYHPNSSISREHQHQLITVLVVQTDKYVWHGNMYSDLFIVRVAQKCSPSVCMVPHWLHYSEEKYCHAYENSLGGTKEHHMPTFASSGETLPAQKATRFARGETLWVWKDRDSLLLMDWKYCLLSQWTDFVEIAQIYDHVTPIRVLYFVVTVVRISCSDSTKVYTQLCLC